MTQATPEWAVVVEPDQPEFMLDYFADCPEPWVTAVPRRTCAEEWLDIYRHAGWRVRGTETGAVMVLGEDSGLTAVRISKVALPALLEHRDLECTTTILRDHDMLLVYAHPLGLALHRDREIKIGLTLLAQEQAAPDGGHTRRRRQREHRYVVATILSDGTEVRLPDGGDGSPMWAQLRHVVGDDAGDALVVGGSMVSELPAAFTDVFEPKAEEEWTLTHSAEPHRLMAGHLFRSREVCLVVGADTASLENLLWTATVEHLDMGRRVVWLNYADRDADRAAAMLNALGADAAEQPELRYVDQPAAVEDVHLSPFGTDTLAVVNGLPGACAASGVDERFAPQVAGLFRVLRRWARAGAGVVLVDRPPSRGERRPYGSPVKAEKADVVWFARTSRSVEPGADGLVHLALSKGAAIGLGHERPVRIDLSGERAVVEWDDEISEDRGRGRVRESNIPTGGIAWPIPLGAPLLGLEVSRAPCVRSWSNDAVSDLSKSNADKKGSNMISQTYDRGVLLFADRGGLSDIDALHQTNDADLLGERLRSALGLLLVLRQQLVPEQVTELLSRLPTTLTDADVSTAIRDAMEHPHVRVAAEARSGS